MQPVALRFSDASDEVSAAMEFVGATTLAESLWNSACGDGVVARVVFLPPRASAGAERRELAGAPARRHRRRARHRALQPPEA